MHADEADLDNLRRVLAEAGCVAPSDEARELAAVAADAEDLRRLVDRRRDGEPLAWVTGRTCFCGLEVKVEPGVYVPRWQSEPLARRAAALLPDGGIAVDLCTGSGAVAMVLADAHATAQVVASDIDTAAVRCAEANGVVVYQGDLDEALPRKLAGKVDVMTAVVPYVPRGALALLPRDVTRFEPRRALDGGESGLDVLPDVVARSPRWLKAGGWLLLEVGMDQVPEARVLLRSGGFTEVSVVVDQEGDPRAVVGSFRGAGSAVASVGRCRAGVPGVRSERSTQEPS